MLFFYLLLGYLIGSIPGITFFTGQIDNFNKKTMVIPKKGITISYYPSFNWQWILLAVDFFKLLFFYYMLQNDSFVWIFALTLGHIFPFWKPTLQKSVLFLLLVFLYLINIYIFWLIIIIEIITILFNKNLKEIPLFSTAFLLAIFYWVSGADIYFVLISLLFFVFSLLRFITVSSTKLL